jgi:ADP-ribose pyrophosphatase YjhB (NUDIX family)
MKYCSICGEQVILKIPADDTRERYVCISCETIHYQNPNVVAGCIPVWDDRVLLCRRSIEPRYGLWTLPAGFMEMGETSTQAALRETLEEANARVEVQDLYVVINLPQVNQVYMMFRSRLLDLDFRPGAESLQTALFTEAEIPWNELAFRTIRRTLEFYFEDSHQGIYPLHFGDFIRENDIYIYRPGPAVK